MSALTTINGVWLLEELRVAQFAQGLGARGPVSSKRIRKALAAADATAS